MVNNHNHNDKKWVTLNVGGSYFTTKRSTIIKQSHPSSPLNRMLSNSTHVEFDRDERGAIRIDRDPIYFQVILNFMRHGHLVPTRDTTEEGLLIEAKYYCVPNLIKYIERRLATKRAQLNGFNNQHSFPQILPSTYNTNALLALSQVPYQQTNGTNQSIMASKSNQPDLTADHLNNQADLLANYVNQVLGDC